MTKPGVFLRFSSKQSLTPEVGPARSFGKEVPGGRRGRLKKPNSGQRQSLGNLVTAQDHVGSVLLGLG